MRITRSGTTAVARRYQDLLGNTFQGHDALQNSPLGASSGHSIHGATGRVLSDGNAERNQRHQATVIVGMSRIMVITHHFTQIRSELPLLGQNLPGFAVRDTHAFGLRFVNWNLSLPS